MSDAATNSDSTTEVNPLPDVRPEDSDPLHSVGAGDEDAPDDDDAEDVPDERPVALVITPEKRALLRRRLMFYARKGAVVVVTSLHHDHQVMLSVGLVVHVAADFIVVLRVGSEGRSSKISLASVRDVRPVGVPR